MLVVPVHLGPQENNFNSMKVLLAAVWKGDSEGDVHATWSQYTGDRGALECQEWGKKGLTSVHSSHAGAPGPLPLMQLQAAGS